jgi:hypothetical protein
VVGQQPALREQQPWLHERLYCVAELLVDRQINADDAASLPNSSSAQGAWAQFGITQMDDQQHAISAMLAARNVDLDAPNTPRRTPVPKSALLVMLSAIALLNPARLMQRGASCSGIRVSAIGVAVLTTLTVLGGPILRTLDISAATSVVAAGAAIVVTTLFAFGMQLRSRSDALASNAEFLLYGILRPETMMLAIAVGAGGQGWTWSVTIALVLALTMSIPPLVTAKYALSITWLSRVLMVAAIVFGIALIVDGVYAV